MHKAVALTLVSYLQSCPQPVQSPNTETKEISLKYKSPPVNFLSAACTSICMLALWPATLLPSFPGLPSGVSSVLHGTYCISYTSSPPLHFEFLRNRACVWFSHFYSQRLAHHLAHCRPSVII